MLKLVTSNQQASPRKYPLLLSLKQVNAGVLNVG